MKKNVLIFVGMLFAVPILFIFFVYYNYEPYSAGSLWYERFYLQKKYIANSNKQKIVFAGGSSTLFGIDTSKLEKELKIPVINYAVAHGLRTDYILYDVRRVLSSGDIVVLPMEDTLISYNDQRNDELTNFILTFDREYFYSLNINKKFEIISSIGPINVLEGLVNKHKFTEKKLKTDKLNNNGDIKDNKERKKIRYGLKSNLPKFKITKGIESINDFRLWCEENDITLFISYASLLKVKDYDNNLYKKRFSEIHNYFKDNYIVLGEPKDFFYDKKYMYDTRYHLNAAGRNIRTQQYLQYLKKLIHVESKNIDFKNIKWVLGGNSKYTSSGIQFSFSSNNNYPVQLDLLKPISPLSLTMTMDSKYPLNMIAIGLYNNNEYAYFFFKYTKDSTGRKNIYLSPQNIGKKSNNFKFEDINKIVIRVYPHKDNNVSFVLKSIAYSKDFNAI